MAKLGQDGHDRGAKVIASAFGDFGMDVQVGDLFQTPEEAADTAIEMGAHIGVACGWPKTLLPQLIAALKDREAEDILDWWRIIPQQDYRYLYDAGVAAIFGPGTAVPDAAYETLNKAADHLKRMQKHAMMRLLANEPEARLTATSFQCGKCGARRYSLNRNIKLNYAACC